VDDGALILGDRSAYTTAQVSFSYPHPRIKRVKHRAGILRYGVDMWPVGLVLVSTMTSALPFIHSFPTWQLALIWAAVAYLRTFCAFVQHNHAHLSVFRQPLLNRVFDAVLTLNTGYPTAIWQLHHILGHHRDFLDPDRDVARTTHVRSRARMSRWVYALRGNLTVLRDSIRIGLAGREVGRRTLLVKLALELVVQILLTVLFFLVNPWLALLFFVVPNVLTGFLVWWESYPHHLDLPLTGPFDSSITVEAPDYNFMTFNIGHHTAHHQKPTLHWSLLPEQTAKIRHLIHSSCIKADHKTWARRWTAPRADRAALAKRAGLVDS
jgi:fatty acid desaturase